MKGQETTDGAPLHVGIVDNDPLVLTMLERSLTSSGAPVTVIWTATSAVEALQRCMTADDRPDLTLTDLQMPGVDGFELARRLRAQYPGMSIVGITAFLTSLAASTKDAGTGAALDAIVDKATPARDLIAELATISGNTRLLTWVAQQDAAKELSPQELEVMRLYSDGYTNDAIARRLNVSLTTVKTYGRRAFEKLGVHSRTEAAIVCLKRGLI